ncbi:MAG: IS200/IS605 family transposase [Nanoarchaeota archaeon]
MDVYQSNTHAHSIGWNTWHFEWCTKYRYKMFKSDYIKNICIIAVQEAAKRHRIGIVDAEVDVDHIHIIVSLPMTMAPTKALHLVKGFSARLIFQLVPNFRKRYPKWRLWSLGKFAASVGHITLESAKKYLEAHHAKALTPGGNPRLRASRPKGDPLGRGGRQL